MPAAERKAISKYDYVQKRLSEKKIQNKFAMDTSLSLDGAKEKVQEQAPQVQPKQEMKLDQ